MQTYNKETGLRFLIRTTKNKRTAKTLKFEYPNSTIDTVVLEPNKTIPSKVDTRSRNICK